MLLVIASLRFLNFIFGIIMASIPQFLFNLDKLKFIFASASVKFYADQN